MKGLIVDIRKEAGKKAWETRRKNEQHQKRSEAAKKAWETIRARKTAEKTGVEDSKSRLIMVLKMYMTKTSQFYDPKFVKKLQKIVNAR